MCATSPASAGSATGSVRVACCIAGHLEVEHRIAIHHIQAPRCHVAHDLHDSHKHMLLATQLQYQGS